MSIEEGLLGVEVELKSSFSVIRESLERLGIVNDKNKEVYPSCYILHKRGKYYIIHFKNLLKLDGKTVDNFDDKDKLREKSIAVLLEKWGLVEIVYEPFEEGEEPMFIFVLPYEKRKEYTIVHKYNIGVKS
jgi:hypothetical protein